MPWTGLLMICLWHGVSSSLMTRKTFTVQPADKFTLASQWHVKSYCLSSFILPLEIQSDEFFASEFPIAIWSWNQTEIMWQNSFSASQFRKRIQYEKTEKKNDEREIIYYLLCEYLSQPLFIKAWRYIYVSVKWITISSGNKSLLAILPSNKRTDAGILCIEPLEMKSSKVLIGVWIFFFKICILKWCLQNVLHFLLDSISWLNSFLFVLWQRIIQCLEILILIYISARVRSLDICLIKGLILGLHPANERRRYFVTTSFIGWAHA